MSSFILCTCINLPLQSCTNKGDTTPRRESIIRLLPNRSLIAIHLLHVLLPCSHPAFDATRQDKTLHLALAIALLDVVCEPAAGAGSAATG